jgi:hypothetical protein
MSSPDAIQCAGLYAILCRFAAGLYVKENWLYPYFCYNVHYSINLFLEMIYIKLYAWKVE